MPSCTIRHHLLPVFIIQLISFLNFTIKSDVSGKAYPVVNVSKKGIQFFTVSLSADNFLYQSGINFFIGRGCASLSSKTFCNR